MIILLGFFRTTPCFGQYLQWHLGVDVAGMRCVVTNITLFSDFEAKWFLPVVVAAAAAVATAAASLLISA